MKKKKKKTFCKFAGVALGLVNWVRITFAVELTTLDDGLGILKPLCERHAKK